MSSAGIYFLLAILIVFFMLLYVYATPCASNVEKYANSLLPSDKVVYIQGNGIPDAPLTAAKLDQDDPNAQSVDGTANGPKSMFMFAYNSCSPSCCDESSYSCNGGCVCLTPEQKMFLKNPAKRT